MRTRLQTNRPCSICGEPLLTVYARTNPNNTVFVVQRCDTCDAPGETTIEDAT